MSGSPSTPPADLADPHASLAALLARLSAVDSERVTLSEATGRVLAEAVRADRPSPSCDVSAMDGYAVRIADLSQRTLPISGEVVMGQAPPDVPVGQAVRIFTGGAVPASADAVIKREDVVESADAIDVSDTPAPSEGMNIRRRGENIAQDESVIPAGTPITPAVVNALANFGVAQPVVHRPVRVAVIVTGDELRDVAEAPEPWQLRDSNGPALASMLGALAWVSPARVQRAADSREALQHAVKKALVHCDALVLTGGVSMGDHDHVPAAVQEAGGAVVFHKLAQKPGRPLLGAVGAQGQAILGLPGNPVSVMVTARRFALPALRCRAGYTWPDAPPPVVSLTNTDGKQQKLWWYRPVRLVGAGEAELVPTMGSGDLVSAARSDGVVELPPGATDAGPWPFFAWDG